MRLFQLLGCEKILELAKANNGHLGRAHFRPMDWDLACETRVSEFTGLKYTISLECGFLLNG